MEWQLPKCQNRQTEKAIGAARAIKKKKQQRAHAEVTI
jgi:hypothetical protein